MKIKCLLGLILVFAAGFWIHEAAALTKPPVYTAKAQFSINWNQMWTEDQNSWPGKHRQDFDKTLAKFKVSDQFISLLCREANIPATRSTSLAKDIHRYLTVERVGVDENSDVYCIKFSDNDRELALKAVNLLNHRFVNRMNRQSRTQSSKNAVSDFQENEDVRAKEDQMRTELAGLLHQPGYSAERQARIQELKQQLDVNDFQKMTTGFKTFFGVVGAFTKPAKIEKSGVVKEN